MSLTPSYTDNNNQYYPGMFYGAIVFKIEGIGNLSELTKEALLELPFSDKEKELIEMFYELVKRNGHASRYLYICRTTNFIAFHFHIYENEFRHLLVDFINSHKVIYADINYYDDYNRCRVKHDIHDITNDELREELVLMIRSCIERLMYPDCFYNNKIELKIQRIITNNGKQ